MHAKPAVAKGPIAKRHNPGFIGTAPIRVQCYPINR